MQLPLKCYILNLAQACRALMDGGAVFVNGNGATLTNITNSTIIRNSAQSSGGACSFNGGVSVLASNQLGHNWAGGRGGAVAYRHQCFVQALLAGNRLAVVPTSSA